MNAHLNRLCDPFSSVCLTLRTTSQCLNLGVFVYVCVFCFFFLLTNRAFLATLLYECFHFYEDLPFFTCLFYSSSYKLQSHPSFTCPLKVLWLIISGLWRGGTYLWSWRCLQLLRIFSFLPQNLLQCIYILTYLCLV